MATRKIKFPVVLRQNDNSYSNAYGRYYSEAVPGETLSLSGLLAMVAFDQSVYTEDIVKGVVQAVTRSMVELLKEGQPVKWDGLGTFTPTIENTKGGATEAEIVNGTKNVNTTIAGVHIRFIPENTDGQKLTSRVFGDRCLFDLRGVLVPTVIGAGKNQKKVFNTVSLETWRGNANG